jgi:3-oxoadipate enol-lactonase
MSIRSRLSEGKSPGRQTSLMHGPAHRYAGEIVGRTRYTASGDLRIAYELRGSALTTRPTLLLIQGLGLDASGWGTAIRHLQRRFRLVLIDNRGIGRSAVGSVSVPAMVGDVCAVLDNIGIGAAHVLGASLGGIIAQDLAIRHPERVDKLVLACTTPGWPFAYPMPLTTVRLIAASGRLPRDVAARRHVENALSAITLEERPDLVEQILARQQSAAADQATWHGQVAAGASYVGGLRQRGIRARTLILHGGADRVVDPRNARLLAARIPHARLVTFPGLGHLFFWEDPAGFADVVTSFLLDDGEDARRT